MHFMFDLPLLDNAAYPQHELAITVFSDFLLQRVGRYERLDAERGERSHSLRTRFDRTHTFKMLILDRASDIAARYDIDTYVREHFGKRPVFQS